MTVSAPPEESSRAETAADHDAAAWLLEVLRESRLAWLTEEQEESIVRSLSGGDPLPGELAAFLARPLTSDKLPYLLLRALRISRKDGSEHGPLTGVAVGIDAEGRRELLGICRLGGSSRKTWPQFLEDLVARRLSGVQVVVTDAQAGVNGAVVHVLPGVLVLRSREAVLREVLAPVPAQDRSVVALLVNSIYSQPSAAEARAQYRRVADQLRGRSLEAADRLKDMSELTHGLNAIPEASWHRVWPVLFSARSGEERVRVTRLQSNFFVVGPSTIAGAGAPARSPRGLIEGTASVQAVSKPAVRSPWPNLPRPKLPIARLGNVLALPAAVTSGPDAQAARRSAGWPAAVIVGITLVLGLLAHVINLFSFPRYELDEGTYMSSAWAVLNDQITAYPYGYGHPPLGWIQIAIWTQLTGGFFAFGNALNSGRVLMVLYDAGSSLLVYLIAQRVSGRRAIGLLAMVIFSFSPLSLLYQRQVFLDNIAVFWLLLSFYMLIISKSRMRYLVGAGLAFGCALLSKETIALFIPVMVYGLWLNLSRYQRLFGLVTFTYTVIALGFSLILLALIKGELFPYAWHLPWDHHPHLSLLDTLSVQVHRSASEGSLIEAWTNFWTNSDPWLIALSIGATAFNVFVGIWQRQRLFFGLAAVSYWLLLLRGGVVLPFYVIILIPLAALNVGLAVDTVLNIVQKYSRSEVLATALVGCLAVAFLANDAVRADAIYTQHPTTAQTQAVVWIRDHVPQASVVVVNSYLYMDLRQQGGEGVGTAATYPYAHVYWNIAYDPELHDGLLQSNWDRIDYIVADSEMLRDITTLGGPMTVIAVALQHSVLLQEFRTDDNERLESNAPPGDSQIVISVYQVIHKLPPATPFNRS